MRLSQKQQIFTLNVAKLISKAEELGIGLTFGDAFRHKDLQYLYYHGLTFENDELVKTRRKTRTMNSMHLKRLAVDFNFFINGKLTYKKQDLQDLGDFWESLNKCNRWGGNFKSFLDTPHFEMTVR